MFKFLISFLAIIAVARSEVVKIPAEIEKSGTVCEICTVVLSGAQQLLEQNRTESEILGFIEKQLCARLGPLNSTCVEYVESQGKTIIYELASHIHPSIVCNHLGLCQTQKFATPSALKPITNSLNCTLCKLVFKQVQDLLKNNVSQQQIIKTIENRLCNATGQFSNECDALIAAYGPTILNLLGNEVNPEKVCNLIGMCTQKAVEKATKVKDTPFCTTCEFAIKFVDVELKKNKTESEIISSLEKVCSVAPKSTKAECDYIISSYGPYLINFAIKIADPQRVCQALSLC